MTFEHVACVSWGNDSVAMVQHMHECGLKSVACLYNDTGWALKTWPARVMQMQEWAMSLGYVCFQTKSKGMEALVKERKGWPRQGMQFCTDELKIWPTQYWLSQYDASKQTIICVGVKRVDSSNRAHTPEFVYASPAHDGRFLWHPLYAHTVAERDALIERAGFEVLPHRSKECGVCINEKRQGLRDADPDFIAEIDRIENELGWNSKGNYRAMFRPYRHMNAVGIYEIVRWAKSERGEFDPDDGTGYDCDGGMCGT